jgi:hypothetical protein
LAEDFKDLAREIGFEAAAESLNVTYRSTDLFVPEFGYIPFLGKDDTILEFVNESQVGEVSDVIRRPNFYLVVELEKEELAGLPPFEEVRERVKRDLEMKVRETKIQEVADAIYEEVQGGKSLDDAAHDYSGWDLKVEQSDFFSREEAIPGVAGITEFHGAAFALDEGEISPPVVTKYGVYIIEHLGTQDPGGNFQGSREEIVQRMTNTEISQLWTSWTRELMDGAKVKDYRGYVLY